MGHRKPMSKPIQCVKFPHVPFRYNQHYAGNRDIFVIKMNGDDGSVMWTRQVIFIHESKLISLNVSFLIVWNYWG